MRLIGMLDSPFVRRVGVSMKLMGLPFSHESVSVFRHFDHFADINPVVKAPTLVTDDGTVLMESSLILDYLDRLVTPEHRLMPEEPVRFASLQRVVGLALAASEKSVQIYYEHQLRPEEKRHQPWLDRVHGQLADAYRLLEEELSAAEPWLGGDHPSQADVTTAVAWEFTRYILPGVVPTEGHSRLVAHSQRAEALPAFQELPINTP